MAVILKTVKVPDGTDVKRPIIISSNFVTGLSTPLAGVQFLSARMFDHDRLNGC